jgi:hypothetical protein
MYGKIRGPHGAKQIVMFLSLLLVLAAILGCEREKPKTKLVYFGFDNRAEKQQDALRLAKIWTESPPCPHWRATIKKEDADYQVLFGIDDVSIVDRRGEVLYNGATDVLEMPHGNPDGSGVNICKLTGE